MMGPKSEGRPAMPPPHLVAPSGPGRAKPVVGCWPGPANFPDGRTNGPQTTTGRDRGGDLSVPQNVKTAVDSFVLMGGTKVNGVMQEIGI